MQIKLDKEDVQLIAQSVAEMLHPKRIPPVQGSPIQDLKNWIRAESLYEHKLFSASTLNRYYKKGLIGKSIIGGISFYKISDILELLESKHVKKEVTTGIGEILKEKTVEQRLPCTK